MGMERTVDYPDGATPAWGPMMSALAARGLSAEVRMIDGLPALPGEVPEGEWREVRVSLPAGMVTLRREPGRLRCVVWGNADPDLCDQWELLAGACAEAGGGTVTSEGGGACDT